MPGVLIVEAMAQTGAVAVLAEEENRGRIAFFAGIDDCRFKRVVSPGETLSLVVRDRPGARPDRPRQGDGPRRRRARGPRHADLRGGAMIGSANGTRIGITGLGVHVPDRVRHERRPRAVRRHVRRVDRRAHGHPRAADDHGGRGAHRHRAARRPGRARRRGRRPPHDIDLLICATVTPDMMFPTAVGADGGRAGRREAAAYDLLAGCTGFMYAIAQAYGMLAAGLSPRALVVGGDVLSKILDWTDRSTLVLFGDGAGAVVMEPVDARRLSRLRARRRRWRRRPPPATRERLAEVRGPRVRC